VSETEQNTGSSSLPKAQLPIERQPDAVPEHPVAPPPSLWTYAILLIVATLLVALAFRDKTDWPGLLINLAAGIFGAVIVLVFVERRLRESEIQSVRSFPRQLRLRFGILVSPTERESYGYGRVCYAQLRDALRRKIRPKFAPLLLHKVSNGFLLLAPPGNGKTTSLQFVSLTLVEEYLKSPRTKHIPILFPLARSPNESLEEALLEHMNSYVKMSARTFSAIMRSGKAIILLDGFDELIPAQQETFAARFSEIRARYPQVRWSISSRPTYSPIDVNLPVVILPELTQEEIREIRKLRFA
jgi:hypothetical protein